MLHAVVMAGGSGTRFWPMSRTAVPKQLLSLVSDRALVVETVARLDGLCPPERTLVVTNLAYADRVRALLPDLPATNVIGEPSGRDTAACIGLAAALLVRRDPDAVIAVLAADHVVSPADAFRAMLRRAVALIERRPQALVTFGIRPTRPATGYGYLERGEVLDTVEGVACHRVKGFREKPDEATARRFLASGGFFWNAGIFVYRAAAILERIARFLPELAAALPAVVDACVATGSIPAAAYQALPKISIDYGVMERDEQVAMLECDFQWDDVGSFAALERVLAGDAMGNRTMGDVVLLDASDNVVMTADGHVVAALGVADLVIVHTADVTLVCRKDDAERVKQMVDQLRERGRGELL